MKVRKTDIQKLDEFLVGGLRASSIKTVLRYAPKATGGDRTVIVYDSVSTLTDHYKLHALSDAVIQLKAVDFP